MKNQDICYKCYKEVGCNKLAKQECINEEDMSNEEILKKYQDIQTNNMVKEKGIK